ncbi:STAS domain-containing protein [Methylobacterium sp. WCS2018Hpa-22]|uniref:STAS domain-containing protein n=1 Tax=Methylobacterium sp. WCS2018Hpa-22 TaxID=3073633 RepID=UPI0028892F57|nr:STAS domain-containing protein [Methylobacterium sp. WCS2018Hpa-22]
MHSLGRILSEHRDAVIDSWIERLRDDRGAGVTPSASPRVLRIELAAFLDALTAFFLSGIEGTEDSFREVASQATIISSARARDGYTPAQTATLVMSLKPVVSAVIQREAGGLSSELLATLAHLNATVDRVALVTFSAFVETRERLIERQSRALLDLATPALPIWRHIVLMPLVGIVDTQRARQIMEWLLEALTREEAHIAILDVTGVPVIDSRVALHLTKTVEAARLLGAKVIVTGISPDAAQTLVKLDVNLTSMITRGTLRAGLGEAFRLLSADGQAPPSKAGF